MDLRGQVSLASERKKGKGQWEKEKEILKSPGDVISRFSECVELKNRNNYTPVEFWLQSV